MLIRSEFDIQFHLPVETPMVTMLHLHPSLDGALRSSDDLNVEYINMNSRTELTPFDYLDSFGNRCSRFTAPPGALRLCGKNLVEIGGEPDLQGYNAIQHPIQDLPDHTLQFLLSSRYCEVDRFGAIASDLFQWTLPGWSRASAIRDWVHDKVAFDYKKARSTKTAMDVFTEREGVCRDFQHLAVTLSRAMNIPARYVTGYLGDIRVPYAGAGDFSAWYQVWLSGRWWDMDARHNQPRMGRLLMAAGRDAADVAITTSFGQANLTHFYVESNEVDKNGVAVPLPVKVGDPLAPITAPVVGA
ncbi:transglutaminase-like domain-containing protein [Terriglobus saanensis]|uniref:Transglutaminase domain-containing protein n=1 Tax=Terriglobus saanensis (strain ATCC BAA-1853 / DSM 23119 / SP1PR4) TaxID=401053 RepID=E8V5Z3_TERSS|nr:transglutaminase domain-containing protein [Terriglobus saanensis]ADV83811.1 transglutaminase domain-containing protein [Terriglobus saanensis SP1PR4]